MLSAPSKVRRGSRLKLVEAGLWFFSAACGLLLLSGAVLAHGAAQLSSSIKPAGSAMFAPADADREQRVIGRLDIARLRLSVPVLSDYDSGSLVRGVGHVPGTAMPGGLGNLVLAGHRDTFFRPLRKVANGMEIMVTTQKGSWRYLVDGTEIVTPEDVNVLEIGSRPELTLITCYPFDFIGAAPKRFIVHAHLVSVDAS